MKVRRTRRVQREKQWIDSSRVELRSALGSKWVGCEQGGRGLTNSSSELDVLCGKKQSVDIVDI